MLLQSEALDKKTPLLRSMEAVSKQAIRVLKALGNKDRQGRASTVGPEQDNFLIDKTCYEKARFDRLRKTLFGAPSPKGRSSRTSISERSRTAFPRS